MTISEITDNEYKYCVIASPSLELGGGIRHIMKVLANETIKDIKARYYKDYYKLKDDEFYICDNLQAAQQFAEQYAKDHDNYTPISMSKNNVI